MVHFGDDLTVQAYEPWRDYYVDYGKLKRMLNAAVVCKHDTGTSVMVPEYEAQKAAFQAELDSQVEKVLRFYKSMEEELKGRAASLIAEKRQGLQSSRCSSDANDLEASTLAIERLAVSLRLLLEYISLNMVAIRKILKKYAKNVEPIAPIPGRLTLEISHPDDAKWRVLQGTFLPADTASDLEAMQHHKGILMTAAELARLHADMISASSSNGPQSFSRLSDRLVAELGRDLQALWAAAAKAERNAELVHAVPWLERAAGMFEAPPPDDRATATIGGLIINNLSTMLFMANYTAILPPMGHLCKHLGIASSWTGAIVGASDAAAIFTAVAVSFWTQRSFKGPLIFSAAACFMGNIVFIASYAFKSLPLLMLSRLLNGLGSARTANRRYTADFVSRANRTMASAVFVGCSNIGQALGPFLSLPLAALPHMMLFGVPINPITAVGLVMASLWIVYFIATAIFFEDPLKMKGSHSSFHNGAQACASGNASIRQPLLQNGCEHGSSVHIDAEDVETASRFTGEEEHLSIPGWLVALPGTIACVNCLFLQKVVQQAYLDGVPVLTHALLSWQPAQNSLFLSLMALGMVPVNALVAFASKHVQDRALVLGAVSLCGAALMALAAGMESAAFYFSGGIGLFIGTVVLEGAATSLMTKVIWTGLARGVLNAGLLSTEAGTLGRFFGNAWLTIIGRRTGVESRSELALFSEALYGTLALGCCIVVVQLVVTYSRLGG